MSDAVLESVGHASRRAGAVFQARMRLGVRSLAAIAQTASLLGSFVTIMEMVTSFWSFDGAPSAILMSASLSFTTVPTTLGLAVAIFAWWGYRYLLGRLEDFEVE